MKLNSSIILPNGPTGRNMRSKFDAHIGRLQMGTHIVTEDFVYPVDKHGREYGFEWLLLTTSERLIGRENCLTNRTPEEFYHHMTTKSYIND